MIDVETEELNRWKESFLKAIVEYNKWNALSRNSTVEKESELKGIFYNKLINEFKLINVHLRKNLHSRNLIIRFEKTGEISDVKINTNHIHYKYHPSYRIKLFKLLSDCILSIDLPRNDFSHQTEIASIIRSLQSYNVNL